MSLFWKALAGAIAIAVWETTAFAVDDSLLFPGLGYIWSESLPGIAIFSGSHAPDLGMALRELGVQSVITFVRIVIGLLLGATLGIIAGMAVHFFARTRHGNEMVLSLIRSIPLFALIPLFTYWFSGKELGIYLYITFAVFSVIAANTYEAICHVPPSLAAQAHLLGASRMRVFADVYGPAMLPELVGGVRNVLGLTWAFSLGAEYLSANSGLGYLVNRAYVVADMGKLALFAILYTIYSVLCFALVERAFSRIRRHYVL